MKTNIEIVRVYDDPGRKRNEYRVLVDRLWPRGVSKSALDFDDWDKDVAPSTELRKWYGHDPKRFSEFSRRYRRELTKSPGADAVARVRSIANRHPVVLLTATRDVEHSGASVLQTMFKGR